MGPSVEVAKKLADAFMVTINYLVDDSGKIAKLNMGLCLLVY
jgi:hypothetical protein